MQVFLAILIMILTASLPGLAQSATLKAKLAIPVREYRVPKANLAIALNEIAAHFQLPMGIEWVRTKATLQRRTFSCKNTTVKGIIQSVLKQYPGYAIDVRDGVVHIFRRCVLKSPQNFLNLKLHEFKVQDEIGTLAGIKLRAQVQNIVSPPPRTLGPHGWGRSYSASVGERRITFSFRDVTVRQILDKLASVSQLNVWVVSFVNTTEPTPTGFYRTVTLWHPAPVSNRFQPGWDLLAWGHYPR